MATLLDVYQRKIAAGVVAPDDDQRRAIDALAALQERMETLPPRRGIFFFRRRPPPPGGLYLWGGVGRGKSMVMDMFFEAVRVERKRRLHFHSFMLEVHDFLHERRSARARGRSDGIEGDLTACADEIAAQSRLLCLDEFQVRDVADAMILGRLFTALFERGVAVVMTSNTAPPHLYENGLQRDRFLPFIALLEERLEVLEFGGATDYRLGRLRDMKVYFWPDDDDARRELERIFRAVADGKPGAPLEIEVKDRVIRVPRAEKEICAFTFSELCEQPRSALDYLELVKRFRVFVVQGAPVMTDSDRNAVIRFVTLIDTLYDHRARIAMSAAAPPERLYAGEENRSLFARTVSRLMEMQSQAYKSANGGEA